MFLTTEQSQTLRVSDYRTKPNPYKYNKTRNEEKDRQKDGLVNERMGLKGTPSEDTSQVVSTGVDR